MTVTFTEDKVQRILSVCATLLQTEMLTIRQVAEVIGILVSNFPARCSVLTTTLPPP